VLSPHRQVLAAEMGDNPVISDNRRAPKRRADRSIRGDGMKPDGG
jgi:hypothetical protein